MLLEEAIKKIQVLELENENLKLENNSLKKIIFGSKSEKTPKDNKEQIEEQCSLFETPEEIEKNVQEQIDEKVEEISKRSTKRRIETSNCSLIICKRSTKRRIETSNLILYNWTRV